MPLKRKITFLIVALMIILAAAVFFLWTNLDAIVKSAIEKYGSQAVGTAVRVDKVSLQPSQGKGAIRGLTVANPKGYSAPHIVSFGQIRVHIEPRSIASNPIVVDDIRIASPLVVYEMNDAGVANVDALRKNLGAGRQEKPGSKKTKSATGEEKRLRIKRLVIENAKVDVRVAALGSRPRTITLQRLEMRDVGGRTGAPPEVVAKEIANAVLSEVTREVGKAGAEQLLEKTLDRALKRR